MIVLGFHFSTSPNVAHHINVLRRRFRQKYWVLLHLREYGFNDEELAKVYRTIVRPVADYCSVVYHPMLTDKQDEALERCQSHSLRCIYGMNISSAKMRRRAGVTTLRQRCIE